jgi:hypothetical protein
MKVKRVQYPKGITKPSQAPINSEIMAQTELIT